MHFLIFIPTYLYTLPSAPCQVAKIENCSHVQLEALAGSKKWIWRWSCQYLRNYVLIIYHVLPNMPPNSCSSFIPNSDHLMIYEYVYMYNIWTSRDINILNDFSNIGWLHLNERHLISIHKGLFWACVKELIVDPAMSTWGECCGNWESLQCPQLWCSKPCDIDFEVGGKWKYGSIQHFLSCNHL